jgi:hypothetical protein
MAVVTKIDRRREGGGHQRLRAQGDKIGTVDHIMIDKVSGRVTHGLRSFGRFLSIGEKYHPSREILLLPN